MNLVKPKQEAFILDENAALEKLKLLKEFVKIQSKDKELFHNYYGACKSESFLLRALRRLEYLVNDASPDEIKSAIKLYSIQD
jgi:hypothetical protein